ncbi:MAG: alpha/beta fold hydrolase [Gemmatimonadetes bacterium]|nr:alpha/beta fold hydrolase [Gemmatimonadota bacterium]
MLETFRGHLPESDWYPAHTPDVSAHLLELPDGERARVVEAGPTDGAPVVLVHGWACSAYFFRRLMAPLAAAGYRAVALDLRGHGGSSRPTAIEPYTAPAMRAFVVAALDAVGIPRAHVVAHSLGGGVSLDLAAFAPARVRSLTLLAPVGLAPVRFVTWARLFTPVVVAPLVPYAVPRWSMPLLLRAVYGREGRWASRDVDEYWAPTADPAFARALHALLHHYRFAPRADSELAAIQAPTLVLLGDRDLLVRSRASAQRAQAVGWPAVTFPGAGHVLAEEVPDQVLDHLLPHLARCGGPGSVHSPA